MKAVAVSVLALLSWGCATAYVNTGAVDALREHRRLQAVSVFRASGGFGDAEALRIFVSEDFVGAGVDVTRLDALKEYTWRHLLAVAVDGAAAAWAQDYLRKSGRGDRGGVVVNVHDNATANVTVNCRDRGDD